MFLRLKGGNKFKIRDRDHAWPEKKLGSGKMSTRDGYDIYIMRYSKLIEICFDTS